MTIRSLTTTWEDPMPGARAAQELAGVDFLRKLAAGDFSPAPFARLLGATIESVEPGRVTFAMVPGEQHYNPIGVVHGGLLATLLDSAMGCAVQSKLPAGSTWTTVELHTNFVRPVVMTTGKIVAEGTVLHAGSRVSTAEGRIVDGSGKLYAHATTTCLVFPARPS
ncbi:MAG: PaaI family thioesterase [Gemmatimonadota bacterium]